MEEQVYEYDTVICAAEQRGGAYVAFPYNVREEFRAGRVRVHAEFDGEPYDGSIVNMGVKNPDGSVCYIIGIQKAIRQKIRKQPGDTVHVVIRPLKQPEKKVPGTVDEYIAAQPEELQPRLYLLRDTLRSALPDVQERISWGMPTYWKGHNIIHFALAKKHIGVYPGPEAVEHFAEELQEFPSSKGTIQFPHNKPLPTELIARIAVWCYQTGNHP